jgi:hypothetical protein
MQECFGQEQKSKKRLLKQELLAPEAEAEPTLAIAIEIEAGIAVAIEKRVVILIALAPAVAVVLAKALACSCCEEPSSMSSNSSSTCPDTYNIEHKTIMSYAAKNEVAEYHNIERRGITY